VLTEKQVLLTEKQVLLTEKQVLLTEKQVLLLIEKLDGKMLGSTLRL